MFVVALCLQKTWGEKGGCRTRKIVSNIFMTGLVEKHSITL